MKTVYLLTSGDGSDGDEWYVQSIHASKKGANKAKKAYERRRYRPNGTWYTFDASVEEWEVKP